MESTTRITQEIYQVLVPIPFPLRNVNCYLVREADGWTMIDTGLHYAPAFEAWEDAFRTLQMTPRDIRRIILTHTHPDHYGLAGYFQQISSAPVYALDEEIRIVPRQWSSGHGHTQTLAAFLDEHGAPRSVIERVSSRTLEVQQMLEPQPVLSPLHAGDEIQLGEATYRIHWTPGHADGHLILHREHDGVILSGDLVLLKITPNIALWPGLDQNPLRSFLTSLDQLELLNPSLALPGHRGLISDVPGRIRELREHHRQRLQACYEGARDGCSGYQVCLRVFPRLENVDDIRLGLVETLAHLEYLVGEGRLERLEDEITSYRQRRRK